MLAGWENKYESDCFMFSTCEILVSIYISDKKMLSIKQGAFYALKNPTINLRHLILQQIPKNEQPVNKESQNEPEQQVKSNQQRGNSNK